MHKNHLNTLEVDDPVEKIGTLIQYNRQLAREAEKLYALEVDAIIKAQNSNPDRIQHCLDGILDYCFDDNMLLLFKKLCRHYYVIYPVAVKSDTHTA